MQLVHPERVISAGELQLEPMLPKHAHLLFGDLQAAELYRYIPHDPPSSVEALERRYLRWSKRQADDGGELWLNYAVYRPADARYVGTLQATLQDSAETYIAYEVFPRYWRQHIATRASAALIDHLFGDYDVPAVCALVDTRNIPSWKLLESLGFRRTRTIKNADEFKGEPSDEYAYELSHDKWRYGRRCIATPS